MDFVSFLEILAETKFFKLMEKLKWYIQREKTNEDLWPKNLIDIILTDLVNHS